MGLGRVDVWQFVFPGLMVVLTGPAIWVLVEAALLASSPALGGGPDFNGDGYADDDYNG